MSYIFELAKKEDLPEILNLYKERVQWMDDNGFHQWNETDYLNTYQKPYFEGHLEKELLFVLRDSDTDKIAAAAVLLEHDPRWSEDMKGTAYYVSQPCNGL